MDPSQPLSLRIRRIAAALGVGVCLSLGGAGMAFAQDNGDQQELPDPDAPAQEESAEENGSGALPETGVAAAPLVISGLLLLSAGAGLRPVVRRRRQGHDEWLEAVRRRRPR